MNFEQYLAEAADPVLNKWLYDVSPSPRLRYNTDNDCVIELIPISPDGVPFSINVQVVVRNMVPTAIGTIFMSPFDKNIKYERFIQWFKTREQILHQYYIKIYSLPTKEQFNRLWEPTLPIPYERADEYL